MQIALPDKVVFDNGALRRIGELSGPLGERALLVTGARSLRESGVLDRVVRLLRGKGISATVFDEVQSEPSLEICERAIETARGAHCDMVIGIGGGSVLDVGKTVAGILPQVDPLREFFHSGRGLDMLPLPFVAVPTTAGTGSECTNNAVLTDTDRRIKKSLRDEQMIPDVALVDPELTLSVPPDVTAQAGMDALTQAIECYVSGAANAFSDALSGAAIPLIAANLPGAVENGNELRYREPVAKGSLLTAMAFANAGLGAVHGLAHPLGARFGIPHGLVCAVLLPSVCAFNLDVRRVRFEEIAAWVGAGSADAVPDALAELNRRVGIPPDLKSFGVAESDLGEIVQGSRSGSMRKNPREASDDDLAAILREGI